MEARRIYRSADYVIRGWVGLTIVRNRVPGDHDRTDDIDESEKSFVLRPTISSHSFRSLEEITRIFLAMRQRNGRNGEDLPSNGSFRPPVSFESSSRWIRNSKITRSEIVTRSGARSISSTVGEVRVRGKIGVEGTLIRSRRRIHLSRSSDRLPIVYGIKSCSRFKRSP